MPGLAQRWGRDVLHCPYCHGWEVRDRVIGVLACGPMFGHQVSLLRRLSEDVTVFLHRQPPLAEEQAEELAARGGRGVAGAVAGRGVAPPRRGGGGGGPPPGPPPPPARDPRSGTCSTATSVAGS